MAKCFGNAVVRSQSNPRAHVECCLLGPGEVPGKATVILDVCVCVCAQFSSVGSISHTFVLFDSQDKSGVGGSGGRLSLLGKTEVHRGAGVPAQALNAYLYYLLVLLNLKKLA